MDQISGFAIFSKLVANFGQLTADFMIKILITDDHQLVIDGIQLILGEADDFQCVGTANNGERALELLATTPADVLLLDINMPGMDGLEITRQIRGRRDAKAGIPIIVITADTGPGIQQDCHKAGAQDLLLKPVAMQPLLDTICLQVLSSNPDMDMI